MIQSFKDLGIKMERMEAIKLFNRFVHKKFLFRKFFNTDLNFRMDSDGSLNISFDEWRDFLLLADSSNIHDLISYWRHSTVSFHCFCFKFTFNRFICDFVCFLKKNIISYHYFLSSVSLSLSLSLFLTLYVFSNTKINQIGRKKRLIYQISKTSM